MEEEKTLLNAVVALLVKDDTVTLGHKLKKIGAGRLNGPGGGIDDNETIIDATIRELGEETGKKVGKEHIEALSEHLEKVAIIDFHNKKSDGTIFVCRVHFFIIRKWTGVANDTDEMINFLPYNIKNLPIDQMMPADKIFFPLILNGKKIIGTAKYSPFQKELLEPMIIEEVESFPED